MAEHETFSIRPAESADSRGILACLSQAFEPFRTLYRPAAFEDTVLHPESLRQRLAKTTVFVAVNRSNIVIGTIACNVIDAGEGHIRGMAVLPDYQGAGIADALLGAAERELRLQKCSRITLDTTQPLQRAIRFYERNGFGPSGRIHDFFGMPLFEYVKNLGPG
jgi:putative acetyltransferase